MSDEQHVPRVGTLERRRNRRAGMRLDRQILPRVHDEIGVVSNELLREVGGEHALLGGVPEIEAAIPVAFGRAGHANHIETRPAGVKRARNQLGLEDCEGTRATEEPQSA